MLTGEKKKRKMYNLIVVSLSFIWGKIRTAAWEAAPHIALRNCSKERGQYIRFW